MRPSAPRHGGILSPSRLDGPSAAGLIDRIDGLTLENSGSFWHAEGYELPW